MVGMSEHRFQPKQLSMSVSDNTSIVMPDVHVPEGYDLRGYHEGDEESWLVLLHLAEFVEDWTVRSVDEYIKDPVRFAGSRVVAFGDQIVSAAFSTPDKESDEIGYLDYVVTHPAHRRKGLSRAVCSCVMEFFRESGYRIIRLLTDDWRLSAIGLYLSLGFEPEMTRCDMPGRWDAVREQLVETQ